MKRGKNDVDVVFGLDGHTSYPVTFARVERDFFVALPGGVVVRAPSCEEAKRKAKDALSKMTVYDWRPIIVVELDSSYDEFLENAHGFHMHGTKLNFAFDRLEIATHPLDPKVTLQRKHAIDFEASCRTLMVHQRASYRQKRDDPLQRKDKFDAEGMTVLPYADATWEGLLAIKRIVDETRDRLERLMKRPDFGKLLQGAAAGRLDRLLSG